MLCLLGSKVEDRGAGGGRLGVREGVWDAGVNRGEKVIGIRQLEGLWRWGCGPLSGKSI